MEAAAETPRVLAEAADSLEPVGLQEEAEMPARILAEFAKNSRKKDKLLCSQLQVVDLLQSFLAQEDVDLGLNPLVSEDSSRQKAIVAKEQWKELKASYLDRVEAMRGSLSQFLPLVEEAQRRRAQLQEAFEQLAAKKQVAMEQFRAAQEQWQRRQEQHLADVAKLSAEAKERQTGTRQKLGQSTQELAALKQQAEQEQDKLRRNQAYLQLLCNLWGKLPVSEGTVTCPDLPKDGS